MMHYKTIVLEMLSERRIKVTMDTLDHWATELRASHQSLMAKSHSANPHLSREQIASETMERAIKNLEELLPPAASDGPIEADPSQTE